MMTNKKQQQRAAVGKSSKVLNKSEKAAEIDCWNRKESEESEAVIKLSSTVAQNMTGRLSTLAGCS